MDKLLEHINSLDSRSQIVFARACGTSIGYLRKACSKKQKLGPVLCVLIEKASAGKVTRAHLRSDWSEIWPELTETTIAA